MPVKSGALIKMQGIIKTVDGKTKGAVYVFADIT